MRWLFAVALGMKEQKGSAVAKALVGSPEGVAGPKTRQNRTGKLWNQENLSTTLQGTRPCHRSAASDSQAAQ